MLMVQENNKLFRSYLFNYDAKLYDFDKITGSGTSTFAKKVDLFHLNSDVYKQDVDKLKTSPIRLNIFKINIDKVNITKLKNCSC